MVCQMDCSTGNLLGKFRASTKAISSISTSLDGRMWVTAAGLLKKVFNCSDYRKANGTYILHSVVGEKFFTIWKIDHTKNRSACCALPVEQPIICSDCKGFDDDNGRVAGLNVLAVSEAGLCCFWHGTTVQSLHERKPTTISLSVSSSVLKSNGSGPVIYSAKFQGIAKSASVTRLDRANAEDAVIPFPKINEYLDKKRKRSEPHFEARSQC